jgi:hypothetical protein
MSAGTVGCCGNAPPGAELVAFLGEAEHNMGLAGNTALDDMVVSEILKWYTEATREG